MSTTDAIRGSDELVTGSPAGESKSWNWHPHIPIQYSPVFTFPLNPVHMLFHAYWLTLATATSHCGYEALVVGNGKQTIATFFHQLHHRYFTCNYGNVELPMDRWFGSFNDGTSDATRRLFRAGRAR
jgi:sterol desaturase/sphingolipid hydroxylase (fatty acid hydroxylase superfamily)